MNKRMVALACIILGGKYDPPKAIFEMGDKIVHHI
jgi:hypothetical protein